jgi:hypothetical protein
VTFKPTPKEKQIIKQERKRELKVARKEQAITKRRKELYFLEHGETRTYPHKGVDTFVRV